MGREASSEDESAGTEVVTRVAVGCAATRRRRRPAARAVARASGCSATRSSTFVVRPAARLPGDPEVDRQRARGRRADPRRRGARLRAVAHHPPQRLAHARHGPRGRRRSVSRSSCSSNGLVDVADGALVTEAQQRTRTRDRSARSRRSVGIGVIVAALTAAAPWLSRGWRRWGWVQCSASCSSAFVDLAAQPSTRCRPLLVGWIAGAATLVLLGAPSRRPTADARSQRDWSATGCRWRH